MKKDPSDKILICPICHTVSSFERDKTYGIWRLRCLVCGFSGIEEAFKKTRKERFNPSKRE